MKKYLAVMVSLVIVSLLCSISCTKDESTEPEPSSGYSRTVVIEFFTYHHCVNCPLAEAALDSIHRIHGDSLVVIEYHLPIAGDTLSPCTTFVSQRQDLYSVTACPTVDFDGVEEVVGAEGDLIATYRNIIESRFDDHSSLKQVLFDAEFIDAFSVSFNMRIMANSDITGRLFLVLTEDSVVLEDSVYNSVARQVYPDENGMNFTVSEDDTFGVNGSISLSWQPQGNVHIAFFVQNLTTGEIYQGGIQDLGTPSAAPYEFGVTVTPDTSQTGVPAQPSVFTFNIDNTGSNNDDYLLHASEISTVIGWSWMLCSGGVCKLPDHGHIYDTISVASQSSDSFTVEIIPNDSTGTQALNVSIVSAGDSTLTESFNINTHIP